MAAGALRVAVIVGTFGAGQGSGGQAELLVAGLRSKGHAVRVWSRTGPSDVRIAQSRGALFGLMASLPRDRIDVVFAFERVPGAEVVRTGGGVHARWLDSAVEPWRRWRMLPKDRRELRLDRHAARAAKMVVCNSARVAAEVQASHDIDKSCVIVVRNGVDLERFRPQTDVRNLLRARHGATGRVALFLGHGGVRKGLKVAAAAFRAAAEAGDQLWVAGSNLGPLPPGCVHLGEVDPAVVLPAVDALVLPTRYDPSANVTLEALACGVPAVTSGRDGASEVIRERRIKVVSPVDVQGFAQALRYAWSAHEPERWRAVAEAWPASRMVVDTETVLRRVVHG